MGIKEDIKIVTEDNRVLAECNDEVVGHITVPEIDFQWCQDTFVTMGGIGGVSTNEKFRRRGIAGNMMNTAVAYSKSKGYVCGGVSTGANNIARRLYSRAGYEYVFSMQGFARKPRSLQYERPLGTQIRGYRDNDEHLITQLRCVEYGGFFGTRKLNASRWLATRQSTLKDDSESVLLAIQDGEIVGYASYFQHWFNIACDICVLECREQLEVGRMLLRALESRLVARKCNLAVFSATEDEPFIQKLLEIERYKPGRTRVFKVNILNLNGMLHRLANVFEARIRASSIPDWTGIFQIETQSDCGVVEIGSNPELYHLSLTTSEPTLTQVLCGRMSGWEAYLRGLLNVTSNCDEHTPILLQTLLPEVPCCHPIDEWW